MSRPIFVDNRLHVMADKCNTCIFRPGNLMGLAPGRVKAMVDGAVGNDSVIPCHKTIHGQRDQEAVCRGFYDAHGDQVQGVQVAKRLGLIKEEQ